MRKLVVLAEFNCVEYLNHMGIFPDILYTDFKMFKNRAISFSDVDIFVIFAGSCFFSKRHVLEIIKVLQKRVEDVNDIGIHSVTVFTDVFLPSLNQYYKYMGKLENISEYSGWKLKHKNSDIWSKVPRGTPDSECIFWLSNSDMGSHSYAKQAYIDKREEDEELRGLIKRPNLVKVSEA